jgi:hypothetical protein
MWATAEEDEGGGDQSQPPSLGCCAGSRGLTVVVGHGPLDREETKEEGEAVALVAGVVDRRGKDIGGRVHLLARGKGEQENDDEEGEANVDEDEAEEGGEDQIRVSSRTIERNTSGNAQLGEEGEVTRLERVERAILSSPERGWGISEPDACRPAAGRRPRSHNGRTHGRRAGRSRGQIAWRWCR